MSGGIKWESGTSMGDLCRYSYRYQLAVCLQFIYGCPRIHMISYHTWICWFSDCKRGTEITYNLVKIKVDATPIKLITESYSLAEIHLWPRPAWSLPTSISTDHENATPLALAPVPRYANFTNTDRTYSYPPKPVLAQPPYLGILFQ